MADAFQFMKPISLEAVQMHLQCALTGPGHFVPQDTFLLIVGSRSSSIVLTWEFVRNAGLGAAPDLMSQHLC